MVFSKSDRLTIFFYLNPFSFLLFFAHCLFWNFTCLFFGCSFCYLFNSSWFFSLFFISFRTIFSSFFLNIFWFFFNFFYVFTCLSLCLWWCFRYFYRSFRFDWVNRSNIFCNGLLCNNYFQFIEKMFFE